MDVDYFPFSNPTDAPERAVALMDLRYLLSFKKLDAWGMDALIDTLSTLVPEINKTPAIAEHSTIADLNCHHTHKATPAEITDQTGNTPNCNTE